MPRINQLPATSSVAWSDVFAIDTPEGTRQIPRELLNPSPIGITIPTGQWSGSGPYTYTLNATNVDEDTVINAQMDGSIINLTSALDVTPGEGTITLSTETLPSGTITVYIFFPGIVGDVEVQVLADVYTKSQTYSKSEVYTKTETNAQIAQSTADAVTSLVNAGNVTDGSTYTIPTSITSCRMVSISFRRYGYCAAVTLPYYSFVNGANTSIIVWADNGTHYVTFRVNSGVITIIHDGLGSPIMELMGIK